MSKRFLNIDLEIITSEEPTHLLNDFGQHGLILFSGPVESGYLRTVEVLGESNTSESVMSAFVILFKRLSDLGKAEWQNALKREFNFGYEVDDLEARVELSVSPDFVAFVATHQASLGVTIYRVGNG
jgi:hypothetical protein